MAFTATLKKHNITGNQRVVEYKVTADAATGAVATPLGLVDSAFVTSISAVTSAYSVQINKTVSAAAQNGSVYFSGVTNGDDFFLVVYGRS